jgi:hypothetical protein
MQSLLGFRTQFEWSRTASYRDGFALFVSFSRQHHVVCYHDYYISVSCPVVINFIVLTQSARKIINGVAVKGGLSQYDCW